MIQSVNENIEVLTSNSSAVSFTNDDIKNIEILLSFATPEHLLYKMTITKDSEGKYNVNVKKGDVPHDWYRDWTRKRKGKKKETKE